MDYTLEQIAEVCGGRVVGHDMAVTSVFVDSRGACGSGMFVAIRGANHDGHDFVGRLYERRVRAFMVEEVPAGNFSEAGFVVVGDSVAALQALAADYRTRFGGVVAAVTGSNGKTMVKEWIAQLLPADVKLFRSPKSYNSQVGVPLSVLMMDGDERVAVFEAGISETDEMERLAAILRPDVGVITNIGDAHQENFDSVEQKLNEKLKLFAGANKIVYSSAHKAVVDALARHFPEAELIDAKGIFDGRDRISSENASLAIAACHALGFEGVEAGLSRLQPVAMRLEQKEGINGSVVVNDFYNSDINSLAIALDHLSNVAGGRPKMLIISDILQSGMADAELYARVAEMVATAGVENVVAVGERIKGRPLGAHATYFATTESALAGIKREEIAGRAILIKGNRRAGFEKLSHTLQLKTHTTTLEINLDAMIHNLNAHRAVLPKGHKIMAMVKASGYGHGDYEVAAVLQNQGVDYIAVAFADEGAALRERGITVPIVVLNADEDSFDLMLDRRLEPEIYNFRSLETFVATASRHGEREYPIHIKLDVGMHRLGFEEGDLIGLREQLRKANRLVRVESVFAHLAGADEPQHDDFTREQIARFDRFSGQLIDALGYTPLRHLANTAAMERFPTAAFDMCRLGIGLYGIGASKNVKLQSVETLRSRIVQIKQVAAGETIGYGREGKIVSLSRIATIPVGYADGLDRHLGMGRWSVLVGGKMAPTVGRICMDTCMVDVTGIDVREGDPVVVLGDSDRLRVADMALALDTIPYEIMTSISSRIKRIFIKE